MCHRIHWICTILLGVVTPVASLLGGELATTPTPPPPKTLVLRNGQAIEGRITQKGDLYIVDLSDGEIRIKAADVDLICDTLDEGYQRKRAAIQLGNVHHHLELAQWCLRHGLIESAAAELADATAADPANPMLGAMQHRLKMATEPLAAADTGVKKTAGPSNEELDRMVRNLPRGAVETFTQSVQPLLMNYCATSGCHGPQTDGGLQLVRIPTGKPASRRVTQRNLNSVLAYVDRENAAASRLLTAAGGPHGTVKRAVFSEHEAAQYNRLVEWVRLLAQQPTPEVPATVTPATPVFPPDSVLSQVPPQVLSKEAQRANPLSAAGHGQTVRRGAAAALSKPGADGAEPGISQSADPFDPEIFNRRHASERSAKAESSDKRE